MSEQTTVRERPILFSGPMVRAIREGRKTQTRRVMRPQPGEDWLPHTYDIIQRKRGGEVMEPDPKRDRWGVCNEGGDEGHFCPYGAPGDRLWVRESFWQEICLGRDCVDDVVASWGHRTQYAEERQAPGYLDPEHRIYMVKRPSIHMPRALSRITLEVVGVRVERLQDITEEDAIAEGAQCPGVPASLTNVGGFARLWDSINAKRGAGWASNPWVWVVEFRNLAVEVPE